MKKINSGSTILGFLLSLIIITIVAMFFLNTRRMFEIFSKINYLYFSLALLFQVTAVLFAGLALYLLTKGCVKLSSLLPLHYTGYLLADLTPGKSGYLAIAFFTEKPLDIFSGIMVMQALSLLVRITAFVLLFFYFSLTLEVVHSIAFSSFMIVFIAVGMIILVKDNLWEKVSWIIPEKFKPKIEALRTSLKNVGNYRKALLLVFLSWPPTALRWFFVFQSINVLVDPIAILLLHPIVYVVAFTPITPGGFGLTETVGLAFQPFLGVGSEELFSSLLIDRVVEILASLPFFLLFIIRYGGEFWNVIRSATMLQRGK